MADEIRIRGLEVYANHGVYPEETRLGQRFTVDLELYTDTRRAYVALGSNLGDRRAYLEGAVRGLAALPGCRVKAVSEFIETEPFGYTEQPRFLNGCLALDTLLPPLELLDELQKLEQAALRERKLHWGPRTLDLDLLFYEDLKMDSARLTLPHPGIAERDFVLRPLAEIAPDLVHPVLGKPIRRLLAELEEK